MAKRRTRREKIEAQLRRKWVSVVPSKNEKNDDKQEQNLKETPSNFQEPEISLSLNLLKRDLTKSLSLTILALILLFGLAGYLNSGGWQTVYPMLEKTISVEKINEGGGE